ncbi:MAG: DUF433 domain-containing protein [Chloroflexi bacterium]|nr:DUF433 domain-containing protein [Chloroflexota bacterium]
MVVRNAIALKEKKPYIVKTPGIAGGRPRIDGHRIRVQDVVIWHETMAMSPDEIADQFDLTLAEIHAALAYYYDHIKEIRRDWERDKKIVEQSKKRHPSKLQDRIKTLRG